MRAQICSTLTRASWGVLTAVGWGAVLLLVLALPPGIRAQTVTDASWTTRQLSDGQEVTDAPAIVGDKTGVAHMFWPQSNPVTGSAAIFYARFDGTTWTTNDILAEGGQVVQAAIDDSGVLHLVWTTNRSLRYSSAPVSSAMSARAWRPPVTLADGAAYNPDLLSYKGTLHLVYSSLADPSAIRYLRSSDGGATWERGRSFEPAVPDASADRPRLAMSPSGILHLVWSLVPNTSYYGGLGVYYTQSSDSGRTWAEPLRLDDRAGAGAGLGAWQASVGVQGENQVHVVWDAHVEHGQRYHAWSNNGGAGWTRPTPIWGTFISQTGPSPMITDSSGKLYLFSSGAPDWSQRQGVYFSTWAGSNWTDPRLISAAAEEPHYLQVALTGGNVLHTIWLAREQKPPSTWYASARTLSRPVQPEPFAGTAAQARAAQPTASPAATPGSLSGDRSAALTRAAHRGPDVAESDDTLEGRPRDILLAGMLPVVIGLAAVMLGRMIRFRRRWGA